MRIRWFAAVIYVVFTAMMPVLSAGEKANNVEEFPRRNAVVAVVEKVNPSVVNISTERLIRRRAFFAPFFDKDFDRFFGTVKSTSLGSGVIIDPNGYILTNAHVVFRASTITVTLCDKSEYKAVLLAVAPKNDLALLKIEPEKDVLLRPIEFGTSGDLMIGETAIALGNPFGLSNTVTVGVISAVNRSVMLNGRVVFKDFLQTDAAINPGNSGGPLLNINGKLIGINTAIRTAAEGIGFAIPVDRVLAELAVLVNKAPLASVYAGFAVRMDKSHFYAKDVTPDGPAAKAGLKDGDELTAVDGKTIKTAVCVAARLIGKKPGDKLTITVRPGEKEKTAEIEITLAARPETPAQQALEKQFGMKVSPLTYSESQDSAYPLGCLIVREVEEDSPATRIGVQKGDRLLELSLVRREGQFVVRVNPTVLENLDDLAAFFDSCEVTGGVVAVTIVRGGEKLYGKLQAR